MGGRANASPQVVVHCVHGTWPRGVIKQLSWNISFALLSLKARKRLVPSADSFPAPSRDPDKRFWFESGSQFERTIRKKLGVHHEWIRFERVLWSGNNSFGARKTGAEILREHLKQARLECPQSHHLVLAHSHGGTISVAAVDTGRRLFEPPGRNGLADGVMTLGTPFVRMVERPDDVGVLAGLVLPTLTMILSVLAGLHVLVDARVASPLGWLLVVLAGVAMITRHMPLAAGVLATYLMLGPGLSETALVLSLMAWIPTPARGRSLRIIVAVLITLQVLAVGFLSIAIRQGFDASILQAPLDVLKRPMMAFMSFYTGVFVVWLLPSSVLSLAVGWEALSIPGLVGVDAEPLPYAAPEESMKLVIDAFPHHKENGELHHALYEFESIQTRVADWIGSHLM